MFCLLCIIPVILGVGVKRIIRFVCLTHHFLSITLSLGFSLRFLIPSRTEFVLMYVFTNYFITGEFAAHVLGFFIQF